MGIIVTSLQTSCTRPLVIRLKKYIQYILLIMGRQPWNSSWGESTKSYVSAFGNHVCGCQTLAVQCGTYSSLTTGVTRLPTRDRPISFFQSSYEYRYFTCLSGWYSAPLCYVSTSEYLNPYGRCVHQWPFTGLCIRMLLKTWFLHQSAPLQEESVSECPFTPGVCARIYPF